MGTTGRRPLGTDLAGLAVVATVVSFTPLGWVMGFGLAVAIYVDDRMADEPHRAACSHLQPPQWDPRSWPASAVPSARCPSVDPVVVGALGVLALIAVLREPLEPVSFVDSRTKKFIRRDRLQAGRVARHPRLLRRVVSGANAPAVVPMTLVVATALASSEMERLQRASPAHG